MKKIIAVVMCFVLCLSLFGCSAKTSFDKLEQGCEISKNVFENKDMGIRITVPTGEVFYTTSEIEKEVYGYTSVEDDTYKKAKEGAFIFAYSSGLMNGSEHYLCATAYKNKMSSHKFFEEYEKTYSNVKGAKITGKESKEKIGNIEFDKRIYSITAGNLEMTTTIYYGIYDDMAINISYLGDEVLIDSIK